MAEHQKKELKLLRRQKVKLKASYDQKSRELKEKSDSLTVALKELAFLQQKDAAFEDADKAQDELKGKIEDLEAINEGLKIDMEDYEFKNKKLSAELSTYKIDLNESEENYKKSLVAEKKLQQQNDALDKEVDRLKAVESRL